MINLFNKSMFCGALHCKTEKSKVSCSGSLRAVSVALMLVMLIGMFSMVMASVAYAAWPEFQGDPQRTGQITNGTPYTLNTNPTPTTYTLPFTSGPYYIVNVEPLLETVDGSTYAYVLYNGGGMRGSVWLTKLDVASLTQPTGWPTQLSVTGVEQLSTPYIDEDDVYVGVNLSYTASQLMSVDKNTSVSTILVGSIPGQINTPITKYGDCLYFGTWNNGGASGANKYYQYNLNSGALNIFIGCNHGFYWAGAQSVTINDAEYIVFGSDVCPNNNTSYLHVTPAGTGFGTHSNDIILSNYVTAPGNVRSSISTNGTHIFFTSQGISGIGGVGYLWCGEISTLLNVLPTFTGIELPYSSTSTPTISNNNIIYVGIYSAPGGNGNGGVVAATNSMFTYPFAPKNVLITVSTVGPVQASPIVYSTTVSGLPVDYVYYTTNMANGQGYCNMNVINGNNIVTSLCWNAGGSDFALQGFASDNGYLVYGDNSGTLYII
ncbi:MAG: hypothetical protein FWH37_02045 [Candidatus Bathyarchaeota archaeon]|nr:hypothetical protein [Candidatus Termiticorpusculum sp.]